MAAFKTESKPDHETPRWILPAALLMIFVGLAGLGWGAFARSEIATMSGADLDILYLTQPSARANLKAINVSMYVGFFGGAAAVLGSMGLLMAWARKRPSAAAAQGAKG